MENKKNPCYCISLRRAAFAATEYYDKYLKQSKLTTTQYSMLNNIQNIEGCSVSALAREIHLDRTTVVRNLKILYANGYIVDNKGESARNSKLYLTAYGSEVLGEAHILWEKAQNELEHIFGRDIMSLLSQILVHMGRLK